jgi:hypothetical protein
MPPSESNLLLVAPLPQFFAALLFKLNQILLDGLHEELFLMSVLLNDLLDFLHFLVKHLKQLGILFIFYFQLVHLLLTLGQLGFQG